MTVKNATVKGYMASGAIIWYNQGTVDNLTLSGKNIIYGVDCVGGCLENMKTIKFCKADIKITAPNKAHAVGGLCGYSGTADRMYESADQ